MDILMSKERPVPNYRVSGIRDSEAEGWFKHNPDAPQSSTARIDLETALGTIIVEVSGDSMYPGIYLSFRENGKDYERTVALLEVPNNSHAALHVWEDPNKDDWTYRMTVAENTSKDESRTVKPER